MLYEKIIKKEPISKGWSGDQKYKVTCEGGDCYLLRISPRERYENRARLFDFQRKVGELGISMCRAVELGECDEGVYSLQTWIDGEDAEQFIPTLPLGQQYALGICAGRIARKIHSLPAPDGIPDWGEKFSGKIDRKIRMYEECPLKLEGGEHLLDYIEKNRHLIHGRAQSFQHGDFHIGNMMVASGELYIIDFDRYDFGDPWEEFKSITWCAQASPLFASGMVNGYFDNNVPMEFWKLLALYISLGTITSLPWAIPYGEGEVQTMKKLANEVLEWYDNMQNPVPSWYTKEVQL